MAGLRSVRGPPTVPGMKNRTLRTIFQVVVAVPSAIAALAAAGVDVPVSVTAWVGGIVGALVVLVTAGQNAAEDAGVIKDRRS